MCLVSEVLFECPVSETRFLKDIDVIFHCGRSLLFHDHKPWIEQDSNGEFDVTMGSYDGVEVGELAGLFMLNELSKTFDKDNIGLYRDNGLSVFKNYNGL